MNSPCLLAKFGKKSGLLVFDKAVWKYLSFNVRLPMSSLVLAPLYPVVRLRRGVLIDSSATTEYPGHCPFCTFPVHPGLYV